MCEKFKNFFIAGIVMVCSSSDFEKTVSDLGQKGILSRPGSSYESVILEMKPAAKADFDYLILFKKEIDINSIAHEATHLSQFEKLSGEKQAQLVGVYTDLITRIFSSEGIPIYYTYGGQKYFFQTPNTSIKD